MTEKTTTKIQRLGINLPLSHGRVLAALDNWHTTLQIANLVHYSVGYIKSILTDLIEEGYVEKRRPVSATVYRMSPDILARWEALGDG